jgi:O-antigen/teichoic acid export membrane protein
VLVVALPLALLTGLVASSLITLLFGDGYSGASIAYQILVWSMPLAALNTVATGALRASGEERWLLSVFAAGALVNVGLNLWVIPAFGIEGAATVTVATELLVFAGLMTFGVRRRVFPVPRIPSFKIFMALACSGSLAGALDAVHVLPALLAALAVYAAVLGLTRAVTGDDVAMLRAAIARRTPPATGAD